MKKETDEPEVKPSHFPERLFVSHFDHSTVESPSYNACLTTLEAIDEDGPTLVAEYKLVSIRKLARKVEEVK